MKASSRWRAFLHEVSLAIFDEDEKKRQTALVYVILLITLSTSLVTLLFAFVFPFPGRFLSVLSSLAVSGVTGLGFYQVRRGRVRQVSWVLLSIIWLVVAYFIYTQGGLRSSAVIAQYWTIVAAGLLLGNWGGPLYAGLTIIFSLGIYSLQLHQQLPAFDGLMLESFLSSEFSVFFALGLLLYLTARSTRAVLGRVRQSNRDIQKTLVEREQAETEIRRLHAELENRVARRTADLQLAADVAQRILTLRDPQELLSETTRLILNHFQLQDVFIYLHPESQSQAMRASDLEELPAPPLEALIEQALREQHLIEAATSEGAPRVIIPLVLNARCLGVLDLHAYADQAETFREESLIAFGVLAGQLAVAIENASLYAEQARRVEQLQELDFAKSAFLDGMSLELRAPLNVILGFAKMMLMRGPGNTSEQLYGTFSDELAKDLKRVWQNGEHLLALLNDLADMAKIESGQMKIEPETFCLREVLNEVKDMTRESAAKKKLTVTFTLPDDIELFADRLRIKQILLNLVGNAVKFTEQGSLTIQAKWQGNLIQIAVQDTGPGIPLDQLEAIFQPFYQLPPSQPANKPGGTGLGLPISRHLAMLHGGHLWAESPGQPGQGATFFVRLPARRQAVGGEVAIPSVT